MKEKERAKDLLIAVFGIVLTYVSFWSIGKFNMVPKWALKFGNYAGMFTWLIYFLRLKLAAEEVDPDSNDAFREYIKLGGLYCFILFIAELPVMIASIR